MAIIQETTKNIVKKVSKTKTTKLRQSTLNAFFNKNSLPLKPVVFEPTPSYLDTNIFNKKGDNKDDIDLNDFLKLERENIPEDWFKLLAPIFTQDFFQKTCFPPENEIYSFTRYCSIDNVKIIIIGQDPYHNDGQAHGLAFSIKNEKLKTLPPSLKNIYKAIKLNYPDIENLDETYGNLSKWCKQGVLLTNRLLTVAKNQPLSHKGKGWEIFQDELLQKLIEYKIEKKQELCFMLWGDQAKNTILKNKALMKLVNENKDMFKIIDNVHPSPLSCNRKLINPVTKQKDYRPWFDKRDFVEANKWLLSKNKSEIDWSNK
ncbi:hypothetical protein ACO0OL_001216 [Hanseniaspora opuntiae]